MNQRSSWLLVTGQEKSAALSRECSLLGRTMTAARSNVDVGAFLASDVVAKSAWMHSSVYSESVVSVLQPIR